MQFVKFIIFLLAVVGAGSCANKNVNETQNLTSATNSTGAFDANAVAATMCDCMTKASVQSDNKKVANALVVAQKNCEKQSTIQFGNFKNDADKVAAVNARIKERCGHLSVANNSPLQGQVKPDETPSDQARLKQEMTSYKKGQAKNKPEPKRKNGNKKPVKIGEPEIE